MTDTSTPRESALLRLATLATRVLEARPRLGTVRLVCVDGPSGAGKTTLADRVAHAIGSAMGASPLTLFPMRDGPLGVQVLHLDDVYEGWDGLPGVGDRLEEWVLGPLRTGRSGRYRRYDWHQRAYAERHEIPARPVLILDGVGSASRRIAPEAVLTIWIDAPSGVRFERGIARDGDAYRSHWDAWAAAERTHFTEDGTRERADLIVDGAPEMAYDPRSEVILLAEPPAVWQGPGRVDHLGA